MRRPDLSDEPSPADLDPADDAFHPFERIDGDAAAGLLLICDHASNALPARYGTLGLPPAELERHIGYDIGAAGVTRALASALGCPAVLSHFSRLLIDPNRGEDDPTLVMRLSDGAIIPGNRHVDEAETTYRLDRFHRPYHRAVAAEIARMTATGLAPAIFSVHSFTPVWRGSPRPWHIALLWDLDPRFARPLIEGLEAEGDLIVGDNEPYDGALKNDCLYRHGTATGLAHVLIEIRQDLIADLDGQIAWADRLAKLLPGILASAELHERRLFGSRTGPVTPLDIAELTAA
ncbi:N-formylglutamate amidohydrolase [Ancylobacter defluvii]|uniref:N-formylglutamate amidohydrolase n=1 Tax=Ancylobacter defluvii TaxID=1282440 RepID=A0A9W6JS25_9HYPH|nr:N-formylglutamate amidohydrolase [Ancylobacter defluvii]MBS7587547.1 N-formylglutamate amidohydrolase [Ancylobacter defluvii]GLK82237.1 N-formylglutamate amidohydrolase [Ancylobacter defluvii]